MGMTPEKQTSPQKSGRERRPKVIITQLMVAGKATADPVNYYAIAAYRNFHLIKALQRPDILSFSISEFDVLELKRAVDELEQIEWTSLKFGSECRIVSFDGVPGRLTKLSPVNAHIGAAYVISLPGISLHYSVDQFLQAVADLYESYARAPSADVMLSGTSAPLEKGPRRKKKSRAHGA